MKESKIKEVFEIELVPHEDERGFFMRIYDQKIFAEHGLNQKWVQENHSFSKKKGTVRGLHFQFPPYAETKLVRAVSGEIYMVFADLRKSSPTFGKWGSSVLSEDNKKMLYVPKGIALGMCALTDKCGLLYKMDTPYHLENQGAIRWNDPDLGIDWPSCKKYIISEKDSKAPSFKEFVEKYRGLEIK